MKLEVNFSRWAQAMRVAFCTLLIIVIGLAIYWRGYSQGVCDLVQKIRQQQTLKTEFILPSGETEGIEPWLTEEYL
jgi:Tfp pilus assembly protein PilO